MDEAPGQRTLGRLRTRADFQLALKEGRRFDGPLFLLVVTPRPQGPLRLGLAVGRRVGGAVSRNRAKRRLREAFRRMAKAGSARSADVVVVAKAELKVATLGEIERELERRFARQERLGRRPDPRPGPRR